MNVWNTLILAKALFSFFWMHVSSDLIQPMNIPEDPCLDCGSFPDSKSNLELSNFSVIFKLNETVAIGTKNAVVFVTPNGKFEHHVPLTSTDEAMNLCKISHVKNPETCFSVIDFIIKEKTSQIVCGRIASFRNCWKINGNQSTSIDVGQYYPKRIFAYLNTDRYLYIAFQNINGHGKLLKLNMADHDMDCDKTFTSATKPEFVSIYEFGDYIYYFFKEYHPEEVHNNKITYSRVARLCKYDAGGRSDSHIKQKLTLFSKARLLCAKNEFRIQFNILQRTSYVKAKDGSIYIYGLFRSSDPSIHRSVVCRFSLSKIDNIFETSKYYSEKNGVLIPETLNEKDPRLTKKCNSSLDTTILKTDILTLSAASSLTFQAVKADGDKPVLELDKTRISHIISESVDTDMGSDSSHVLHMLDSNVLLNAVVPTNLGNNAKSNVFSKQKISKEPLKVLDFKQIQGNMFVAAQSKVAIIPHAACNMYKSCRQCVQARNPHCAWYNSSCSKYNYSRKSEYKQDIKNGDFSNLCDKEKASCKLIFDGQPIPGRKVVFTCKIGGVPLPLISLKKNAQNLTSGNTEVKKMRDEVQVVIKNYNLSAAGNYSCHVKNTWSSDSCSVILPGSAPQLKCRISKHDFWLKCSATGYPRPRTRFKILDNAGKVVEQPGQSNQIKVVEKQSYQFFAYNEFGAETGKIYKLFSKFIQELGINKTWMDDYAIKTSLLYQNLTSKVQHEVKQLYPDSMHVIIDNMTFRKGSCVASFIVTAVTTSLSDVEAPIMSAIRKGKLGGLNVFKYKKDVIPDHQTTNEPLIISPTRPLSLSRTPISTRPPSVSQRPSYLTSPTHREGTPAPGTGKRADSDSVSVKAFVIVTVILIIVIMVLSIIIGCLCGFDVCYCARLRRCRSSESISEENDEMQDLKKSKVRESRRKLLHKEKHSPDGGKKESQSPNNVSKQGSPKQGSPKQGSPKQGSPKQGSPKQGSPRIKRDNCDNDQSIC